ncbi:MAG: antibiotic biosynthesis monooxygenase [Sphingomonadaceae bacterium]|nr:MAG: antibiotic biosynthesis monooxygenase [Sphingomonadaceae bacterium]
MIIITGSVTVQTDKREEALALGCEHSARSRKETGCIAHNCHVDAENPLRLHFFEKWEDAASVKAHFAVPESRQFMQQMGAFAKAAPDLKIYRAEAVDPATL